jgi:DNA repair exonuclease SbcCD ATPase subunit
MITFHTLNWRNFLSTGNNPTKIHLDKSPSTLVVGHNGSGKSTMIDALSFALFGKPHRSIKKAQLVNAINQKDCEVSVDFTIGLTKYKIIRGLKPNKFEIYIDDVMVNQSSTVRDYQTYLEQNILKLNHKSFHQIVVLGASSFVPFMQLNSAHRREVIEDVLDIQVFGVMNNLLKADISKIKEELRDVDSSISIKTNSINMQKKHIREIQVLTESHIHKKRNEIESINLKISNLEKENITLTKGLDSDIKDISRQLSLEGEKNDELRKYDVGIQSGIKRVVKESKFYEENDDCPICKQDIDNAFKQSQLQLTREKEKNLKEGLTECKIALMDSNDKYIIIESKLKELHDKHAKVTLNNGVLDSYRTSKENLLSSIFELQNAETLDNDVSLASANGELNRLTKSLQACMTDRVELGEKNNYNSVIYEILKDTGIKTQIIRQYLPMINQLINQYLQIMDFYISFYLDDSFSETIKSRHRDIFSYDSFSEGEKMKIDLAILFTWREVARVKNSMSTNLLILDETFDSSLDPDGIENLIKILITMSDCNLFVISHKGEILENKFRHKMEFQKHRNFSKILDISL